MQLSFNLFRQDIVDTVISTGKDKVYGTKTV